MGCMLDQAVCMSIQHTLLYGCLIWSRRSDRWYRILAASFTFLYSQPLIQEFHAWCSKRDEDVNMVQLDDTRSHGFNVPKASFPGCILLSGG